jgi:cell shape-determining protein MreC
MEEREKTLRALGARTDGLQNELKGWKMEKKRMQDRIQQLESENQQIREQLEKMKEIDLGIQKKKTEVLQK